MAAWPAVWKLASRISNSLAKAPSVTSSRGKPSTFCLLKYVFR